MTAIIDELERELSGVSPAEAPALIVRLAACQAVLASKMSADAIDRTRKMTLDDQLLGVEPAAKILGVSTHWLYRHSSTLPFTRRLGPKQLRFSRVAMGEWIKTQQ